MNYHVTSNNTKRMLSSSLKKFMGIKSFSKITISEIISDCGVNRKTFYYHFENIYDLLKWTFEQEAIEVVKDFNLITEYKDAINFAMDYIESNKHLINCAYDSLGREEMKRFFYTDFIGIVSSAIDAYEKELKINVPGSFKNWLGHFYTEALAGLLIDWVKQRESIQRELVIENISIIIVSSLPSALLAASKSPIINKGFL